MKALHEKGVGTLINSSDPFVFSMRYNAGMKVSIVVAVLAAFTITALGTYAGWAMDHSLMPPYGGGWRCYLVCIACVWAIPLGVTAIASVPGLCRLLARVFVS